MTYYTGYVAAVKLAAAERELSQLRGAVKQHRQATLARLALIDLHRAQPLAPDTELWRAAGLLGSETDR